MGNQVGSYLHDIRERHGLSLRQVSRQTGLSSSYLSLIERGERNMSIAGLYVLVGYLDGDFVQALHLLALDAGVPEHVLVPTLSAKERSI